jgi:hypothetical protein
MDESRKEAVYIYKIVYEYTHYNFSEEIPNAKTKLPVHTPRLWTLPSTHEIHLKST